jgi:hypothetical protein
MSPFKHNIRALEKRLVMAAPNERDAVLKAITANMCCVMNERDPAALEKVEPPMRDAMKAAGVEPRAA